MITITSLPVPLAVGFRVHSHREAKGKAEKEYAAYRALVDAQPRPVDADFEKAIEASQRPANEKGRRGK